jgi:antitoxin component YwqK of YwqJK toxin-antitoxin module
MTEPYFDKPILIEIINAAGNKKEQMEMYLNLCKTSKQWFRMMQKVKDYFQKKWQSWYHSTSDNGYEETYQGYHFGYKHGRYMKFKYYSDGYEPTHQDEDMYLREEGEYFNNLPHGNWVKYHRNAGGLYAKQQYINGLPFGCQFYYDTTGKLIKVCEYDNHGQLTGTMIEKLNGKIIKTQYKNGKKNGLSITTLIGHDVDLVKCMYSNDLIEGEYVERWSNKKIKVKTNYVNGVLHGEYVKFHENGKHHVLRNYINGRINGKTKTWWVNGRLAEELEMKDDVPHGLTVEYAINGDLKYSGMFENGVELGEHLNCVDDNIIITTRFA